MQGRGCHGQRERLPRLVSLKKLESRPGISGALFLLAIVSLVQRLEI
jgi:hypothetical protein